MIKQFGLISALFLTVVSHAHAQARPQLPVQGGIAFSKAEIARGKAASASQIRNNRATLPMPIAGAPVQGSAQLTTNKTQTSTVGNSAPWMHGDVAQAWSQGFTGRGANITVIDDFNSGYRFQGNLSGTVETLTHGEWTRKQAAMVAPGARVFTKDFTTSSSAVKLQRGFNVMNLSYGVFAVDGLTNIRWGQQEASLINYAKDGRAVVVKAAGNDAVAVGQANSAGRVDYLNRALIGQASAIFVGALSRNGSESQPASLAHYSNVAGSDLTVQQQFLVVGVEGAMTGLYGTSFAAPVVTGYAAIVHNKFNKASASQVATQLLSTARQDTILNYNANLHGRGEASLSRALAPTAIK